MQTVDHVYNLLCLRERNLQEYEAQIKLGESYTRSWDDPRIAGAANNFDVK